MSAPERYVPAPQGLDRKGRLGRTRGLLADHGRASRGFASPRERRAWICGSALVDERTMKNLMSSAEIRRVRAGGTAETVEWTGART